MIFKWVYIVLSLVINVQALSDLQVETFINLMEFRYENLCNNVAQAKWNFIEKLDKSSKLSWENALEKYAAHIQLQREEIGVLANETLSNNLAKYKYNLVTKPGDPLLNGKSWQEFISFIADAEASMMLNNDKLLKESRENKFNEKFQDWTSYYEHLKPLAINFSENLKLVKAAAVENGMETVADYWAMLSGYEKKGYKEIERMWNNIVKLHEKVVKVVKHRLALRYPEQMNKEGNNNDIPGHLVDSIGENCNWMEFALMASPYPNVTFEIEKNIVEKSVGGIQLYKSASRLGRIILRHLPEHSFWQDSKFDARCPTKLINFCDENTRLSTCTHFSLTNYISAHKEMASVLIYKMSRESNPILSMNNRYSPLEAGISELFGILSMSRAWLVSLNLLNKSLDLDQVHIMSLLITALDVLPRMAYYLAVDMWRLDAFNYYNNNNDDNFFNSQQLGHSWWTYREKYEGITASWKNITIPTYLNDPYIINNKPYMHKFLGILLGFQIYDYLMDSTEMRYDKIEPDSPKRQLINMIQYNWSENWNEIITKHLQIDEISTDSILNYFMPLEQYLDEIENNITVPIPLDFESMLFKLKELKNIDIKQTFPSTEIPTPTSIASLPSTTTTHQPPTVMSTPHLFQHYLSTSKHQIISSKEEDKSPIEKYHSSNNQANLVTSSETNKAAWAVGAVLIATIAIVIIGIFGRRRCRKSPKNRRYI